MNRILIIIFICIKMLLSNLYSQTVNCDSIKNENGIEYIDDKKTPFTGNCIMYHKNGKKSFEASYKNGNVCGTCRWYYENGQISSEVTYVLDSKNMVLADGKATKWFQNGKIMQVVNYKSGEYNGEWYELDITGKKIKKGIYKDNKLISGDKHIMPEI